MNFFRTATQFLAFTAALATAAATPTAPTAPIAPRTLELGDYPRTFGMNIGRKHYEQVDYQAGLAKLDMIILGFPKGWENAGGPDPVGTVLRNIKAINPKILIGQYTCLNESRDNPADTSTLDKSSIITAQKWWLRNAQGERVQWTPRYSAYEVNIGPFAPTEAKGLRYPEWLAIRDNEVLFKPHPEFDIWYFDNVMWRSRVIADWDGDGVDDKGDSEVAQKAFRWGQARHWATARLLRPDLIQMGNSDRDLSQEEYQGKLDGAFLEHWCGRGSLEKKLGWAGMMERYRTLAANLRPGGFIAVNTFGARDDYQLARYSLASCLLGDGLHGYTDDKLGYSDVVWFDEYDAPLGQAVDNPPSEAWQNGVWRRTFTGGVALVNPTDQPVTVTLEAGWRKFLGKQAPTINDGQPVEQITLPAKDGILLVREK